MEKEDIYHHFIDYVNSNYDGLVYIWQFSNWKRVTMDRSNYLKAAAHFFEEYYPANLIEMPFEDALFTLIKEFEKNTKILDEVVRK